ncbi:MAG: sodium:solute symporter [Bacteroidetes bacterium]|nr:sodium:solute symporter [Bacteroidota bacterium]
MQLLDWIVLCVTLAGVVWYGIRQSRSTKDLDGYFRSNQNLPWGLVLLGIMGTQASAITFLSAPGQGYTDGMRFVQYYFGIPIAMIVISAFFVPRFRQWNVFTAYEYLEHRFDGKTRTLTSLLFFLQRGLSTGISIFAPSLILSSLLGWNIYWTNLFMGGLLVIYTMSGGARAVAYTQQLQFAIILLAMFLAGFIMVRLMPDQVGFFEALDISGKMGKLNVITDGLKNGHFDWSDNYNIWSGVIGGFFLALSYFGTDQSQVGRFLTGKSIREGRLGLLMNGLVKVPMQFLILLVGALLFSYYTFERAPLIFNRVQQERMERSAYRDSFQVAQIRYDSLLTIKKNVVEQYVQAGGQSSLTAQAYIPQMQGLQRESDAIRKTVRGWLDKKVAGGDGNDTNYIFIRFVLDHLPVGLVGLLIAMIFLASWGSIAAAINSLAACTVVDMHLRFSRSPAEREQAYGLSRWYTLGWGVFCIVVAMFTYNVGNSLIEAVNILGSLFYGVILGVFLVALFMPRVRSASSVFWSLIVGELIVLGVFFYGYFWPESFKLGFLWLNPVGAITVVLLAWVFNALGGHKKTPSSDGVI